MMRFIFLLSLLLFPFQAFASSWIGCSVTAKVIARSGELYSFKVLDVTDQNSGFGPCPLKNGQVFSDIKIEGKTTPWLSNRFPIEVGATVPLSYEDGSSMSERGVISYTEWRLLKEDTQN